MSDLNPTAVINPGYREELVRAATAFEPTGFTAELLRALSFRCLLLEQKVEGLEKELSQAAFDARWVEERHLAMVKKMARELVDAEHGS